MIFQYNPRIVMTHVVGFQFIILCMVIVFLIIWNARALFYAKDRRMATYQGGIFYLQLVTKITCEIWDF